jgi:capsular polysaccharide export protein
MPHGLAMEGAVLSAGIAKIPYLSSFLPEFAGLRRTPRRLDNDAGHVLIGWGNKRSGVRARALAQTRGLRAIALEDGFLRSHGLGVAGEPPASLVADPVGIYYDASRPSHLENLLQEGGWETPELMMRAERCIDLWRAQRLSKYNAAPDRDLSHIFQRSARSVLVVDQTFGDLSVSGGGADAETFHRMLDAAEHAHPRAQLLVKVHPDVLAGKRRGYLAELAMARGHMVLDNPLNPWSLFDGVDRVYTVTSQLGFEAVIAGKEVECFGMPWYAGWGVTFDHITIPRRTRRRSVAELFAAAYVLYARYVDPFTGRPSTLEDTIRLIADLKRQSDRARGPFVCVGFSPWKRRFVRQFLSTASDPAVVFRRSPRAALADAKRYRGRLVVWAANAPLGLVAEAARRGIGLCRMEDGFLRSVGLGSNLVRPYSLVFDDGGIHFDPSRPSEIETLLEYGDYPEELLARARRLRRALIRLRICKYNVTARGVVPPLPCDGRHRILVPGQVENDASVLRGSPVIRTNLQLLRAVRESVPNGFIVFKPHPDVEMGHRPGRVAEVEALSWCDAVAADASILDLIDAVEEVHTMTSAAGFEALLRGKRVTTYGAPFYAGWGLTSDHLTLPRRRRKVSLDELTAAALILYPLYVDPITGRRCPVETVVERLAERRVSQPARSWLDRAQHWGSHIRLPSPLATKI